MGRPAAAANVSDGGSEKDICGTGAVGFSAILLMDFTLEALLPVPLPVLRSAAVLILGALFSVSQLH